MDKPLSEALAKLEAVRGRVESGEAVKQAAAAVYGSAWAYYRQTTEEQRETVYCKPCRQGADRLIVAVVDSGIGERFEAICKAKGVSQRRMLRRLIIQEVALSRP